MRANPRVVIGCNSCSLSQSAPVGFGVAKAKCNNDFQDLVAEIGHGIDCKTCSLSPPPIAVYHWFDCVVLMRHPIKTTSIVAFFIVVIGINAVAYMQARAMTHFSSNGTRTKNPEILSVIEAAKAIAFGVNVPRPQNTTTPKDLGLAYDTYRYSSEHGPILEAWNIPGPSDSPLVLVFHGYAASKSGVLPSAAAFHDLGYSTFVVDFYGSGGSSGDNTSLGYTEAQDVAASLAFARQLYPGRKTVLYGFSMGGAAILRSVANESVHPDAMFLEATFDNLLATTKSRFRTMGLPASPFAQLLLFWGGRQNGFDPFALNPAAYARSVTVPVLLLHGGDDARVPPDQARNLERALGTHGRFVLYPGVPHMLIVSARPNEWKRDTRAFLCDQQLCGASM